MNSDESGSTGNQEGQAQRNINLSCSFCGKYQREVQKLIAGPTVYICNECILLCVDLLRKEDTGLRNAKPGEREKSQLFVVGDSKDAGPGCILGPGLVLGDDEPIVGTGSLVELRYPDGRTIQAKLGSFQRIPARLKFILLGVQNVPIGTEVWAI